jgi:competence protein ComEC
MNKTKNILLWILSLMLALTGLFGLTNSWAGVFLVLAGVSLNPLLKQKLNIKVKYQVTAFVAFFVLFGVFAPSFDDDIAIPAGTQTEASEAQEITTNISNAGLDVLDPADAAMQDEAENEDEQADTQSTEQGQAADASHLSNLTIHFLDVGQADSTLIQLPNGQIMLIDGGNSSDAGRIMSYMRSHNITKIDYLVATHPHADHIGGLPAIIDAMDIRAVYMPRVSHTSQTFERLLTAIQNKGLQIDTARAGVNILSVPGLRVDIIAPVRDDYRDLNDHSAVIKITYNNTNFLFAGDAEALSEGHITADVSADVLKVGHHGSSTSTSATFLSRVAPAYAVISAGSNNTYGHPADTILSRLNDAGANVFRTDLQGTIVFTSDGGNITVDTAPTPYQPHAPPSGSAGGGTGGGNTGGGTASTAAPDASGTGDVTVYITATGQRYHNDGCRHLAQSKIEAALSSAKARGLTPCGTCKPPN